MGRTETYRFEPSDTIYEIHIYFIDKTTNTRNNLECNNILNLGAFICFEFT